jgi:hypothetical protein
MSILHVQSPELNPSPKDREGEEKTGMGGEEQGREGKR